MGSDKYPHTPHGSLHATQTHPAHSQVQADMDLGRTLLTPIQTLRSWSDRGTGIPAQVCPALSQPLNYHPPCLSVVSICGIESESYCLQIAGHQLPNSISGTGPWKSHFYAASPPGMGVLPHSPPDPDTGLPGLAGSDGVFPGHTPRFPS